MHDPLLQRSHAARQRFLDREAELLTRLAGEGQAPESLFIGCSDSRVLAESLVGAKPGDLFVARVVANIVPPHDVTPNSVAAVIEFAVGALGVRNIIICGHTDCGGIRALTNKALAEEMPSLHNWLASARPVLDRVNPEGMSSDAYHRACVEENVLLQSEHLARYPAVERAMRAGSLDLHGWVFDMAKREMRSYDAESKTWTAYHP